MKLQFAIVCENGFSDDQGRLNIIQTFDIIYAKKFPTIYPKLTVVDRWIFENDSEKQTAHSHKIEIIERKTKKVIYTTPKHSLLGEKLFLQFINNIQGLRFENTGIYEFVTYLDGEKSENSIYPSLELIEKVEGS